MLSLYYFHYFLPQKSRKILFIIMSTVIFYRFSFISASLLISARAFAGNFCGFLTISSISKAVSPLLLQLHTLKCFNIISCAVLLLSEPRVERDLKFIFCLLTFFCTFKLRGMVFFFSIHDCTQFLLIFTDFNSYTTLHMISYGINY